MPKVIDLPTITSIENADYAIVEKSTGGTKKISRWDFLGTNLMNLNNKHAFVEVTLGGGESITLALKTYPNYNSLIIVGAMGGVGGVVLGATLNNGTVTVRNLMTAGEWNHPSLVITQSGTNVVLTNNNASLYDYFTVFTG